MLRTPRFLGILIVIEMLRLSARRGYWTAASGIPAYDRFPYFSYGVTLNTVPTPFAPPQPVVP